MMLVNTNNNGILTERECSIVSCFLSAVPVLRLLSADLNICWLGRNLKTPLIIVMFPLITIKIFSN